MALNKVGNVFDLPRCCHVTQSPGCFLLRLEGPLVVVERGGGWEGDGRGVGGVGSVHI